MESEKKQGQLTNEMISKKFRSQFDLVNHAIRLAGHLIHSGHAPSAGSADNIVNDVLTDIKFGRDLYGDEDEDEEEEEEEKTTIESFNGKEVEEDAVPFKKSRTKTSKSFVKK